MALKQKRIGLIKKFIKKSPHFMAMQFDPEGDGKSLQEFFTHTNREYKLIMGAAGGIICLEIEGDYGTFEIYPSAWMTISPTGLVEGWHPEKFKLEFEPVFEGTI